MTKKSEVYFWRQLFILLTSLLASMGGGIMLAFPGVLNPSLLSPNGTDIKSTPNEASWIASSNGIAGILGYLIMPMIMQTYGRKIVYMFLCLTFLTGWLIILCSKSSTDLLIARIIQGIPIGGFIVTALIVSEYTHPTRRGYFMVMKKISLSIGVLTCHVLSQFLNWRQIAGFGVGIYTLAGILTCFWPESPAFLAMKGRFDECKESYVWLNGNSLENRRELSELCASQMEKLEENTPATNTPNFIKKFLMKDFQKSFLMAVLLLTVIETCGRHFFMAYIIQIITEMLGDKSVAVYLSVGIDCITITALLIACSVIKIIKRRTVIFGFGITSVSLMFLISLLLYLRTKYSFLSNFFWLTPCILLFYSFISNLGLIPVCFTLIGEIFPLEHRGFGSCIVGIVFSAIYSIILKITPMLMKNTGLEGTFIIYGACASLCLIVLYFVLPETKDKTLQNIEDEMKGVRRTTTGSLMPQQFTEIK